MGTLNAANTTIQAAEGGFHAPSMAEFFPAAFLFEGTPFEMNRVMLIRVIATVAVVVLLAVWAKRMKLVPGRFQSSMELAMEFVTVGIAEDTMGKERAKKFMPLIVAIFFGILFWNVTKLIPFLNMPGTGVIGLPIVLTLTVYVTYHWAGIAEKGLGGYLKDSLILPGVPWPMHILLIPIEFITKFVTQPFTLAIRLFANMMVGHLLLVLCFSATSFFLIDAANGFQFFSIITFAGGFFVFILEMLIVVLQAYIFALLSCVYINAAISDDH
ncbi:MULTISPECIES: F0F1 ATP synthase subunit A [Brevibacterium]|uniref:ATP synthase subunit a n=3 Tax=Brevibacterium TaxID=1696 RepID=A0A2H1KD23_9MICO|nr:MULTISPECIES: F0F1 ATP synthase subunit A [Brevibacterium]SMX96426.1 ATP synthase F0 subcomplex A subunit [Brevibacterium antiquum]SMX97478.1 ATP synthase F0 subcomplex A subunit [Brevibacterium antiquum CNRZ 918]